MHSSRRVVVGGGGVGGARSDALMTVVDGINQRYGRGAVRLAAEGIEKAWQLVTGVHDRLGRVAGGEGGMK